MSPLTHLLIGWEIGRRCCTNDRDRNLVTWSSVAPDLDGAGLLIDWINNLVGFGPTHFYATYHHRLLHGAFGAGLFLIGALFLAKQKTRTAVLCFLTIHLHLLCDLMGSRGPGISDVWPIYYLAPLSRQLVLSWPDQWPLNGWPNIVLTVVLMGAVLRTGLRDGISPFLLFGNQANEAFVSLIRRRFAPSISVRTRHNKEL